MLYALPAFLPLLSIIWNPGLFQTKKTRSILLYGLISLAMTAQFAINIDKDIDMYHHKLTIDSRCQPVVFYKEVLNQGIFQENPDEIIHVLKDPLVYLPDGDEFQQEIKWGGLYYSIIEEKKPDYIILTQNKIEKYTSMVIDNGAEMSRNALVKEFYEDAKNNSINGYIPRYANDFAIIFSRLNNQP
jgi:hypothetical protein